MKELLLGCGNSRIKRIAPTADSPKEFTDVTTVDMDVRCKPDVVMNLSRHEWHLPSNEFDEVHAYEVLEHFGAQGDYRSYFATFSEIYRILKPGGYLCGSCPAVRSRWLWGDPGHTRVISPESLTFLDQTEYTKQVGKTAMTDYRWCWAGDFELTGHKEDVDAFYFIMKAHKPIRVPQ